MCAIGVKKKVEIGVTRRHVVHRAQIHRYVFADGRMRATAGFHAPYAIRRERLAADQELGVLTRVDVVGDNRNLMRAAHALAERIDERRLTGADGPAHTDPQCLRAANAGSALVGEGMRDDLGHVVTSVLAKRSASK